MIAIIYGAILGNALIVIASVRALIERYNDLQKREMKENESRQKRNGLDLVV